jgi:thymidylate kinase
MKTILITGVDGCGKSTIFEKLKNENLPNIALLKVPHFDLDVFSGSGEFYNYAKSINEMSREADENKQNHAKALALFGSMLMFQKAKDLLKKPGIKFLICERHPLIDAQVYALFYAQKPYSASISKESLAELEKKYKNLISYLCSLLPEKKNDSVIELFLAIKNSFGNQEFRSDSLVNLFRTSFPDRIYCLQAATQVLYQRIADRKTTEAHETLDVLDTLQNEYQNILNKIPKKIPVSLVDASSFGQLDSFYFQFIEKLQSHE